MKSRNLLFSFLVFGVLSMPFTIVAQVKKEPLLALNPQVKTGKLKNGFSYYIQKM
ncbi:hypothetical protein [Pedobacter steynii]